MFLKELILPLSLLFASVILFSRSFFPGVPEGLSVVRTIRLTHPHFQGSLHISLETPFLYQSGRLPTESRGASSLKCLLLHMAHGGCDLFRRLTPSRQVAGLDASQRLLAANLEAIQRQPPFAHPAREIEEGLLATEKKGLVYTLPKEEALDRIAARFGLEPWQLARVNLLYRERLATGTRLFIPLLPDNSELLYGLISVEFKKKTRLGAGLEWPISSYVTSEFGYRIHPFLKKRKFHNGIDIAAPMGDSIIAADDGLVLQSGFDRILGYYLTLRHRHGLETIYGHCQTLLVHKGEFIRRGELIALIGNTGRSTASHLHFGVQKEGVYFNPREFLNGKPL